MLRTKLRELGRLVIEYRMLSLQRCASLTDMMMPSVFRQLLDAVRSVSGFNSETHLYSKPSLALKLGTQFKESRHDSCQ